MTCVSCRMASPRWLCTRCVQTLAPASPQVRKGVVVRSRFRHESAARLLVHRIKYEAVAGVAAHLAPYLNEVVPADTTALVPLPRVLARRWRYGIDPARALASALGRYAAIPVVDVLRPRLWAPGRAGPRSTNKGIPRFASTAPAPEGAVLIDDVVTTGTTIGAASAATGCQRAVTLTAAFGCW
jgi:predicted amidophosphoribosyltransferase